MSIPFNISRASQTIAVLRQLVELYAFTDIARDSGPPWYSQVDLVAGLNEIEAKFPNYTYDYQFHAELISLFQRLNDAHTTYMAPRPYADCMIVRPFSLYATFNNNNGRMNVFLQQGYINSGTFFKYSGFDPAPYFGKEITRINGIEIVRWLQFFGSSSVGLYKDQTIRAASLLQARSSFTAVALSRTAFFDFIDSESFTIENKDVIVPSLAVCLPTAGINSWISAIDNPPKSVKRSFSFSPPMLYLPDVHRERDQHIETILGPLKSPIASLSINPNYVSVSPGPFDSIAQTRRLNLLPGDSNRLQIKGRTSDRSAWYGVYTAWGGPSFSFLKLTTFFPKDPNEYIDLLRNWVHDYTINRFRRVVIDVSKNGGGYVCLSLLLQSILVREWEGGRIVGITGQQVWEPWDLRQSNITDYLYRFGYYDPYSMRGLNGFFISDQWYKKSVIRTRGGIDGRFTQQFLLAYDCLPLISSWTPTYFPQEIIIVTEGTCGSACSLFVTKFQRYARAIVVSHGGLPNVDMDSSSFGGGNVQDWSTFVASLQKFPDFPNKPRQFPTSASARFTEFQLYLGRDAVVPREWNKFPTDFHLLWWDAVYNDDLDTTDGRKAVATLYESTVGVYDLFLKASNVLTVLEIILIIVICIAFVIIVTLLIIVIVQKRKLVKQSTKDPGAYQLLERPA